MMRKYALISLLAVLLCCIIAPAQEKSASLPTADPHLTIDTSYVTSVKALNDYTLIGLRYGVALSMASFDPTRNQEMVFVPLNVGITYTRYGKIFGYMPYFGIQLGAFYTRDAYKFKKSDSGFSDHILGATTAQIETIEIPASAHFHFDFWKMKLMVNLGIFGGYRLSIKRGGYLKDGYGVSYDDPEHSSGYWKYRNSFHPNEIRWDYGIKGGVGFGFIFDPIEIHVTADYKYSLGYLHQPNVNARSMEHDANSKYYYNWTCPTNIVISLGIHYQITSRTGTPRKELRRQAREEAKELLHIVDEMDQPKEEDEKMNVEDVLTAPSDTTYINRTLNRTPVLEADGKSIGKDR